MAAFVPAEDCENLVSLFFDRADRCGRRPLLWAKREGSYKSMSWREVAEQVARLTRALKALGLRSGDRVVLVSENRPEWLISDLAIMAAGGITVPAYTTNTIRDHLHILENSQAKGAIVSQARLAKSLLPAAHQSDALGFVLAMEKPRIAQSINADIALWDELVPAQDADIADVRETATTLRRDDTACLIYTSGTGGAPKGVMLHHGAILHNCQGATEVLRELGLKNHSFLSFLPLSHAYEHSAGQFLPMAIGAQIYYAEGIDKLAANMEEAKPTIMVVVPRLFEMLRTRVRRQVDKDGGLKKALFERAIKLGVRRYHQDGRLDPLDRLQDRLLDRLVRAKVRKRFGGRVKALVSGGAPLNRQVGEFFVGLGLPLMQGYGQTEAAPVISVNLPSEAKIDTVGPPMKGVEVKIAEDGEILVKGELVMQGYWRDEAATEEALEDGWLHTGDVGHIGEDGHLRITDRKKDIIVNDKGENISPQRVEGMLALEPEIAQVMVHGDERPYLVGVVVPDAEWLAEWAEEKDKPADLAELRADGELRAALDAAVTRVNKRLANVEKLRRFLVAAEPFTIDNEQMTPTMKIRRHVIYHEYRRELEALYKQSEG